MKRKMLMFLAILLIVILSSCSTNYGPTYYGDFVFDPSIGGGENYLEITENDFVNTLDNPTSTFSLDPSTAGYANLRRLINNNDSISKNHVKIEEMVNYFSYDYDEPTDGKALAISSEVMDCPWNGSNKIVSIGVKAKELESFEAKPNNIVFLLDISGSMDTPVKLPLMQSAFKLFVETLNDDDTISIVTYAGGTRVALEGVKGREKQRIVNTIEDLMAGGGTAGSKGIQLAYDIAQEYFIEDGNNRVILGTDGDFNVGISSISELKSFISEKRKTGVYLSVLGFGYGNLQDSTLSTLAQAGNGNYAYIDNITEARKVLVEEIGGTLNIVAKDVKTQVTFNPLYISKYRLLGYENKTLTKEEFDDDKTDAGEIGAGHVVTAVYEVELKVGDEGSPLDENWLNVLIRYKDPVSQANLEVSSFVNELNEKPTPSEDLLFISAVIEFGLLLRKSQYKADASYASIILRLESLTKIDSDPYKTQFIELVKKVKNR